MRGIVELGLRFRLLIIALAIVMIIVGIHQLRAMPIDTLPEFAPPYIEVQTEALGLSESEVEELVTYNLEELLSGIPWLQSIRSTSLPGLSFIYLIFEPGTDIIRARQLVNERLTLAYTLPNVAQVPVIIQPLSTMSRVMMVGLSSKEISPIKMSVLARWNIQPALLSVPGVSNVAIWGMRDQQVQVLVDPKTLQKKQIPLDKIISTAGNSLWVSPLTFLNASTPGSGGWIETPQQRIEVKHDLPISTPKDLAQVKVEDSSLRLGEVANLVEGHQPLIGDDIIGNGTGLLIEIGKFPGANTLDVTRGVEEKLATLQPGLSGIQISPVSRPASFIEMQIYHNGIALIIGFLLLTLVLLLFLYSWAGVLISLIAIFISLLAGVMVLNLRGETMNMMVLAGLMLALVIVVDDAILNIENIMQRLRFHRRRESSDLENTVIVDSTSQMYSSLLYATLILLLTLLPLFFLSGLSAAFFRPVVLSYALAIIASIVIALLITPPLSLLLLSSRNSPNESPILMKFKNGYSRTVDWMTTATPVLPSAIAIVVSILTLAGIYWLFYQERPILPDFQEPELLIQWEGPPGTSAEEMKRITTLASNELRSIPGVVNTAAIIGRAILGEKLVNVNSAELIVTIYPDADSKETIIAIRKVIDGYPGMRSIVQTYTKGKIREAFTGSSSDIAVRIFGPELDVLRKKAEEVKRLITDKIKGVTDVAIQQQIDQPQIDIEVDLVKAGKFGLKPGDVRRAASTFIAGIEVGSLFQEQKIFPVVVWGSPETRRSIESIRNLLIDTPDGKWVKLSEVASVTINPTPNQIQHDTVSRYLDVTLNVSGQNQHAVIDNIKEVLRGITFPLEYRAEVLGNDQSQNLTNNKFIALALTALVLIFFIFHAAFDSFRLSALIFLTLPSTLLGAVLVALANSTISSASLLGLITVYGLATRNAILLIKHFQNLEERASEEKISNQKFISLGVTERFSPIIIATLAIASLLLPFAVSPHLSGLEITSPMALIIIAGLITSTLFNLFVVPSLYLWVGLGSSARAIEKRKILEPEVETTSETEQESQDFRR